MSDGDESANAGCGEGEVKSGGGQSGLPEGKDHIRRTDSHPVERTKALASWGLCLD